MSLLSRSGRYKRERTFRDEEREEFNKKYVKAGTYTLKYGDNSSDIFSGLYFIDKDIREINPTFDEIFLLACDLRANRLYTYEAMERLRLIFGNNTHLREFKTNIIQEIGYIRQWYTRCTHPDYECARFNNNYLLRTLACVERYIIMSGRFTADQCGLRMF